MSKQCYTYEMRMSQVDKLGNIRQKDDVGQLLKSIAKKFVFQLERGEENGYVHFQIRASLIKKTTKSGLLKLLGDNAPEYIMPSCVDVHVGKDFDYVLKLQTRLEGPWTDKDFINTQLKEEVYIPRQFQGLIDKLYPYQQQIFDSANEFDARTINVIVDPKGNNGKSTIASICELYGRGIDLPPLNDMKEVIQIICDKCISMNIRNPSPLLVDMPRAMNKEKLYGFYSALEQIKKGKLYDPRHSYKEYWIDSPQIWVFSNFAPNTEYLSLDRWKMWEITEDKKLVPYVEKKEQEIVLTKVKKSK